MNKVILISVLSILILTISSCTSKIVLNTSDSNSAIIVRKNKRMKIINGIYFPFNFSIENNTILNKRFGKIIYEYGYIAKGAGIELYVDNVKIKNNQLKIVQANKKNEYHIYTRHVLDTAKIIQIGLQPYLNKMLKLNQDTLHVGTVEQFKQKHPELFKMLTENDTISIRYLKNKNSGLGERIAIPANW